MSPHEGTPGFSEEQADLRCVGTDDEMFDMVNLATRRTGVPGTIFISTRRATHGPRIKWFPGRPERDGSCLVVVLDTPLRCLNHGLPAVVAREGEAVAVAWLERNREAVLRFWHDGLSWDSDEVQAFIDGLRKLP